MQRIDFRSRTRSSDGSTENADGGAPSDAARSEDFAVGVPLAQVVPRTLEVSPTVVMLDQPRSVPAEKFRRLKTRLLNDYKDTLQLLVVTSPAPREGKSLVALNLALAFSTDPGQTLLIDADLRRPTVQKRMSPAPGLGLAEVLKREAKLDHAIFRLKNAPLRVLPAGNPVQDPVELLSSDTAKSLFATLRESFERIVVDTPPIVPFTDADVLGGYSDGILLVARAGSTPRSAFTQAVSLVTSTRILGTVLNDVTFTFADYGSHYDYYNSYYQEKHEGEESGK